MLQTVLLQRAKEKERERVIQAEREREREGHVADVECNNLTPRDKGETN